MSDKINEDVVKQILEKDSQGKLRKPESTTLEYKSIFDWQNKESRAKYLKTIAAFANRSGGYLIFGVNKNPHKLIGIDNNFSSIDDADITSFINSYLSPSVDFERDEFTIDGLNIGVIYIKESSIKPVVCIKDYGNVVSESNIYYRYYSQSNKIKSTDLIILLNKVKEKESLKWIKLLQEISKSGIENIGTFNISSGELLSSTGNKFILDEKIIKKLKIIDKYSQEKDGEPAVRIIGDIDKIGTVINNSKYICDNDIIEDFLNQNEINNSEEYLKAICNQNSWYLPIYYYIYKSKIKIDEAKLLIKNVNKSTQSKTNILKRLADDTRLLEYRNSNNINTDTAIVNLRRKFYNKIIENNEIIIKNEGEAKRLLEAIFSLDKSQYELNYLLKLLKHVYDNYYSVSDIASKFRQAISYIDFIEFRELIG